MSQLAPPQAYFAAAFPFHLVLDQALQVIQVGASLVRATGPLLGEPFAAHFELERYRAEVSFDGLAAQGPRFVVLRHRATGLPLRGELVPDVDARRLFILSSPVVRSFADLDRLNLRMEDFPGHDAIFDTLMLIQAQEMALADALRLNEGLVRQRAALQQSEERLIALNQAKDEFLAIASHELRTPVAAIQGAADVMATARAGPLTPTQLRFHGMILEQVARLQRLVNDMLDMAALQAGKLRHERSEQDLRPILAGVAQDFGIPFRERGVVLEVALPETPLVASVDRGRITQVLVNLLTNALKFSPPDGTVRLTAAALDGAVELTIVDEGPGIPAEQRARIFEKFVQLDGGVARRTPGVGLGLAICQAIVEDGHGGRIWVEDHPPGGSIFRIRLPAVATAVVTAP